VAQQSQIQGSKVVTCWDRISSLLPIFGHFGRDDWLVATRFSHPSTQFDLGAVEDDGCSTMDAVEEDGCNGR